METKQSPTTPSISLIFWEHFPGDYAGECVTLIPTPIKHSWTAGRASDYPVELPFKVVGRSPLSRIQFTIYYDRRRQEWLIIDGGVYDGEELPVRSKNGFKIKYGDAHLSRKKTAPGEWIKIQGGQIQIAPGDFIWLCPGYRLIVSQDCKNTTVGGFLWEDAQWEVYDSYKDPVPTVDTNVVKDLATQKSMGPWEILADWSDWLQSSPASAVDLVNRSLVGLFLLTVLGMGLTYWHLRNGGDLPGVNVIEKSETTTP